jgi:hypothetical protein
MSRSRTLLVAALVALTVTTPAVAGQPATVTINHQMRGCHSWQFNGGALKPSLSITVKARTALRFVNDDIMPHRLLQTLGPKLRLVRANMNHIGASASVRFVRRGLYRFTTRAGEDYKGMAMKTIGEDNVLQLRVLVK